MAATEQPAPSLPAAAATSGLPLESALSLLGIDPSRGLQLVHADALDGLEPTIPALVRGLTSASLLERTRGRLLRLYPRAHRVTLLALASGRPPILRQTALARLRWGRAPVLEASLYLPALPYWQATSSLRALALLVAHLRGPQGCPWDRQQTPASLAPFVVEEAYEVAEAIADGRPAPLCEELGDLLLQVVMQAQLAREAGRFDLTDIMRGLGAKLVRRHPHVFGSATAETAAQVLARWDELKAAERGRPLSALDGAVRHQPALRRAQDLQARASKAGFDWPNRGGVEAKLREEVRELAEARSADEVRRELGDVLFILAKLGLSWGVDAEQALRAANERFTARFQHIENALSRRGLAMQDAPLDELLALWNEAKRQEKKKARPRRAVGRGAQI